MSGMRGEIEQKEPSSYTEIALMQQATGEWNKDVMKFTRQKTLATLM